MFDHHTYRVCSIDYMHGSPSHLEKDFLKMTTVAYELSAQAESKSAYEVVVTVTCKAKDMAEARNALNSPQAKEVAELEARKILPSAGFNRADIIQYDRTPEAANQRTREASIKMYYLGKP